MSDESNENDGRILCDLKPCPGEAVWYPELTLTAKDSEKILVASVKLCVCQMHMEQMTLNDVLSPEGWEKIAKHLRENGKREFVRKKTTMIWRPTPNAVNPLPF